MEQRNLFLLLLTLRTPWIKQQFDAVHRTAWCRETSVTQTTPQSCSSDILGPVNLESPHAVTEFQNKNKMYPVDRRAAKMYSLPCINFLFIPFSEPMDSSERNSAGGIARQEGICKTRQFVLKKMLNLHLIHEVLLLNQL